MKTLVIKDAAGQVINIGAWDYRMEPVMADDLDNPIVDDAGEVVGYAKKQVGERAGNPLPEGAYEDEHDVIEGADGGQYATADHRALRRTEYPSIGDQLDALFKAGLFPPEMAERIAAVKAKYPKTNG